MTTNKATMLTSVSEEQAISSDGESQNPYLLEGVARVMRVLDTFTADTPELRLTDLSERLGIPKPQVMRIASTLESGGYLERDPDTKRYRLGVRLFSLGMVVQQSLSLKRVAQPAVQDLADASLETVGLFVPDRMGPVCIDVRDSPKGLRVFAQPGRRMPWNAGASGKVILAFMPEKDRERVLRTADLKRYTERTITDPDVLRALLDEIRRTGYHVGNSDLDEDAVGIGAPVLDHDGRIAGAVSVSAPISRVPEEEWPRIIDLVTGCCASISRRLGYEAEDFPLP